MKKIYVLGNKNLGQWSLSQDLANAKYFFRKLDCKFSNNIFSTDVVYSPWHELILRKDYYFLLKFIKKIKKTRIITVISNDVSQKMPKNFNNLFNIIDNFIVPNKKLYKFFLNHKKGVEVTIIPFYIDSKIFNKKNKSRIEICRLLNINPKEIEKKILIGSFQRDSLGKDLRRPKWQKNPDLLIKILKEFRRSDILLVLAGPRRHYIINQCKKHGIPYKFYGNQQYITMNKDDLELNNIESHEISLLYNLLDVYIVTSKSEGGPKAILEAAMTKTFIVSTSVGLAPDILNRDLIYEEDKTEKLVNFLDKILKDKNKKRGYIDYNYKTVKSAMDESKLLQKYKSILI